MGNKQIAPGEWVIMVAGAVMLIASFLDFAGHSSAWSPGNYPIVTLTAIYGVLMGAQIAMVKFAGASLPQRIAGFSWKQLHLAFGVFALLMSLGWLISGVPQKGVGFWGLFLGSIALVVGAVMLQRERHTGAF